MRRALGRGLSQIIADQFEGASNEVAVGDIVPNERQPRGHFDEGALAELAESIREHGILQPLLVRSLAEGKFELIAGERRLRAARLAGLKTVPVIVRTAGAQGSLELALIENIQREDINAIECARAYRRLIDEFDLTQEQVAVKVGKSRTVIANTVRLLRLPKRVIQGLEEGRISEGHARALLAFENEAQQLAVYDQILERGLTVREVERAAQPEKPAPNRARNEPVAGDPNDAALQTAISEHLGLPVKLTRAEFGGRLIVEFYSDDDLLKLVESLGCRV
jgi:ParB family transcriptional regulator, chromosome partitioning protein